MEIAQGCNFMIAPNFVNLNDQKPQIIDQDTPEDTDIESNALDIKIIPKIEIDATNGTLEDKNDGKMYYKIDQESLKFITSPK
jgi:hypothetical protein